MNGIPWNCVGDWETNEEYKEILELDKILTKANIPHELRKLYDGWTVLYPDSKNPVCDVVQHFGSMGGEEGKLEQMGLVAPILSEYGDVEGYLTAKVVSNRIKAHYKKLQKGETK